MNNKQPLLIRGGLYSDERGELSYVNDFDLTNVKRFYVIKHPDKRVVRAWQGHQQEHKYFKCLKGSFVVAWVEIDNFKNPSVKLNAQYEILKASENNVLSVPPGNANGLKALEPGSQIIVFSDYALNESLDDKIRFEKDLWLDWSQF
ncbi:dTDP-4-dehydrorhamnose 3,5-epimerase [Draconibacterium orientale]|uniref:dTDP-4-dehydrorhamnose 3,5-epimerase n=1 Tax=Draconibacterium orientale TaxID=1168034 RepID=X5DEL4_9BACT|nr:WxcM-like domain-containing protein [Draconibacterium orientale]AHW61323.1 dTDP-6-deoxy-3,4-keto-hexulose isomerase [Draconibacterium orientale]SEU05734.1 dTDP-4-dehydrorhamnose 3,5-epimerase [Draconibacterium orientale]